MPPEWHGDFDQIRATRWIEERDAESPTLLVLDRENRHAIGFVMLFEGGDEDSADVDVRLGYVLAEAVWGRGVATELVAGLVEWARSQPEIASLSGGVASGNEPSARVLRKNGFEPSEESTGEQMFALRLRQHLR